MVVNGACNICGNTDPKYFGKLNNVIYCRRCISFKGEFVENNDQNNKSTNNKSYLTYELSEEQKKLSNRLVENFKNGIDSLVYAVCGSGKTELVFKVIEYALEKHLNVGFAIPRRDVVIELTERFKKTFKYSNIIAVYGGHTSELTGDLICLTCHQLFRYEKYFDLIIMDEIDAFPFKGNDTLYNILKRALKGHIILMSATPEKSLILKYKQENHDILTLYTRYHRHIIPVPKIKIMPNLMGILFVCYKLKKYKKTNKQTFVFAPTIRKCELFFKIINMFVKGGNYVHSQRKDRAQIISKFREKKYDFLVTTAVLERGVTVKNLQVIILEADDKIYDDQILIQISGRVGRVIGYEKGDVFYVAKKSSIFMEKAIEFTKIVNKQL